MHIESISALTASVAQEVHAHFINEGTGHDWTHIARVVRNALHIAREEGAILEITALGALLHDIADHKFHGHDLGIGPQRAAACILRHGGSEATARRVAEIVAETSFKGAGVETHVTSPESAAVQDADRLDAIGAIGIARAFAYGGSKGRPLHTPEIQPQQHATFEQYARSEGSTINHFYEKLLLLQGRMHTATGKAMARERHEFMCAYLEQFMKEWG